MSKKTKKTAPPSEPKLQLEPEVKEENKKKTPPSKNNSRSIILIIALFLLVGLAAFVLFQSPETEDSESSVEKSRFKQSFSQIFKQPEVAEEEIIPTPSPSPMWILPGKETYTISQGNKEGPRIKTISIDPQDPTTNGSAQTVTAVLNYSQPIDQVKLKLISDNEEKLADMVLTSGTDKNGTWETNWEITDSVLYKYTLSLTVSSQDQQSVIDLTIR